MKTKEKAQGRRESGAFIPIPTSVKHSENNKKLSKNGKAFLFDFIGQVRFKKGGTVNNGDLCAAPSIMQEYGWNSNESISYAVQELLHYEFIILTRRGDRRRPHLYGITWWAIDECGGKLDSGMVSNVPLNGWKKSKEKWKRPKREKKEEAKRTEKKSNSVPRFAKVKPLKTVDNL